MFACEAISRDRRIIDYAGERISHEEGGRREARYLERGEIWCFIVDDRWVIDGAVDGNLARFINHSCAPNCYSQVVNGTVWIRAARRIEPGEELTYDYGTDGDANLPCQCQPACKGSL